MTGSGEDDDHAEAGGSGPTGTDRGSDDGGDRDDTGAGFDHDDAPHSDDRTDPRSGVGPTSPNSDGETSNEPPRQGSRERTTAKSRGRPDAERRRHAGEPRTGTMGGPERDDGDDEGWHQFVRDIGVTVVAVFLVGAYLFAISGVWPPMVAIESGSMEPNMEVNDMVFVMETDRFQPAAAHGDTGVVTKRSGERAGYEQFGKYGDVIIFEPGGNNNTTPIIHRAMFWVEAGENWCEMANSEYLNRVDTGGERCVADHAGFITKGDANAEYDQAGLGQSGEPVKPGWVIGTAELRIPGLGWFRLQY